VRVRANGGSPESVPLSFFLEDHVWRFVEFLQFSESVRWRSVVGAATAASAAAASTSGATASVATKVTWTSARVWTVEMWSSW
jgi:hypothetical protein